MQSLRESAFPAPGHTVNIKSFIPERGTEVRTSDKTKFCFIYFFILSTVRMASQLRLGLEGLHIVRVKLLVLTSLSEQWLTTIVVIVRYELKMQCQERQQLLHFPFPLYLQQQSQQQNPKNWC